VYIFHDILLGRNSFYIASNDMKAFQGNSVKPSLKNITIK